MKVSPRMKLYIALTALVFLAHLVGAVVAKPSFSLTIYGDATQCAILILALLAVRENLGRSPGVLSIFWKLFAFGLLMMLLSQTFWFYYDWRRLDSSPSPITGDTLFLFSNVFFLSALALRPHSQSAGRNLRIRFLDLTLVSLWWFSLYGYFSLPWQIGRQEFSQYSLPYYVLALIQYLVIIIMLAGLCARNSAVWRRFYLQLLVAFILIAAGNLLISLTIDAKIYYSGGFCDTLYTFGLCLLIPIVGFASALRPHADDRPNRELIQSVWTGRFAMLGILSLPVIASFGLGAKNLPLDLAAFRLRVVFWAMLLLGGLVYWRFNLLALELRHLLKLTHDSIENLNAVQQQVTQSEKLVALGRLAAGAAHEISNPLTAIYGYSELLTDIPSLTPEDRANAQSVQQQVRHAQAAVFSLRNSLRQNPSPLIDKKPAS
jgi:signal transduction histidine kinase